MMREAFERALEQAAAGDRAPQVEPATVELLRSVVGTGRVAPSELPPPGRAKALYAARVLGRHWCQFVHGMGRDAQLLSQLRNEWIMLTGFLVTAAARQRTEILAGLVESLELGDPTGNARKAAYLRQGQQRDPGRFASLEQIPGVQGVSPAGFVIHTIEELAESVDDERSWLHAMLRHQAPPQPTTDLTWLLDALGGWITARHRGSKAAGDVSPSC
jgi:hypothetical protein